MNDAETPSVLANWRSDSPAACRRSRSCAPTPATRSRRPVAGPLAAGTILLSRHRRLLQATCPLLDHTERVAWFKLKRLKGSCGWLGTAPGVSGRDLLRRPSSARLTCSPA